MKKYSAVDHFDQNPDTGNELVHAILTIFFMVFASVQKYYKIGGPIRTTGM